MLRFTRARLHHIRELALVVWRQAFIEDDFGLVVADLRKRTLLIWINVEFAGSKGLIEPTSVAHDRVWSNRLPRLRFDCILINLNTFFQVLAHFPLHGIDLLHTLLSLDHLPSQLRLLRIQILSHI